MRFVEYHDASMDPIALNTEYMDTWNYAILYFSISLLLSSIILLVIITMSDSKGLNKNLTSDHVSEHDAKDLQYLIYQNSS
jgi:hypothetical protein